MDLVILCTKSAGFAAKDFIPIAIAVTVFISNVIYQEINKRNNIRDRISGEVVSICDKMIRYAVEAENSTLMMRYWHKVLQLYPIKEFPEENKSAVSESNYYHRKTEDAGLKLDLLKSELKKHTNDLRKYWSHELQARIILSIMSDAVLKETRRFDTEFNKKYTSIKEIEKDCFDIIDRVQYEVIFNGIGYDLTKIQKIIDPKSPTLLLSAAEEILLIKKIEEDNRKAYTQPKN